MMNRRLIYQVCLLLLGLLLTLQLEPSPVQAVTAIGTPVTFNCGDFEIVVDAKGGPRVTVGASTIYIGYRQLGQNKDPIIAKFTNGFQEWCRTDYEITGADHTGYGLFWDGTDTGLYGVFSATGTQDLPQQDFRRFAQASNGWLQSYGFGGGPEISIIARINPNNGNVTHATFLSSLLSNGQTNSLSVADLFLTGGTLLVNTHAGYSPRNPDRSAMECLGASPFNYTVRFRPDLTEVITASAPGCTGNTDEPPGQVTITPPFAFVGSNTFQAQIQPLTTQLPVTLTWEVNGVVERTAVVNDRRDTFTYTWPAPAPDQTLQLFVSNSQTSSPVASPLYTFDVVEAQRMYFPIVAK